MPDWASRRGGLWRYCVRMRKLTVSVDDFTAAYLESTGNASAWIRQAARAAALVEAGRCYGEFEQVAGLVAPEYQHALLRLHSAQAPGGAAA
jgi:hypothetical protein